MTRSFLSEYSPSTPPPGWFSVKNDSGVTIPAHACVELTGTGNYVDKDYHATVDQPTPNNELCRFTGPESTPSATSTNVTRTFPALALYDTGDGTPVNGEEWGPQANSWKLHKAGSGFVVIGTVDTTSGIMLVDRTGGSSTLLRAKTSECIGDHLYKFELTDELTWDIDTISTGTGTLVDDNCDLCRNVDPDTCLLTLPPNIDPGTGTGTIVYGIYMGLIPLTIGGMAILANMGDTIDSETGTGTTNEVLYRVVEAVRPTIVLYKDRYECCDDGTVVLVGKTPIVVEGVECEECIVGSCGTAS